MSSLAIVEKKPPFAGGGCAGGVLFHLLDWHRRLARKRRLFSPRRLLPSSRRRLPSPPSPTPQPPPAQHPATGADGAAPGVVARLMGLESWPATVGAAAAPRPQKQRKVEASARGDESAVVVVLPPSRRPPAPAPRSHHGADLPARSPRRSRLVYAAAVKLLEPGARASSRASAKLALAYACSSPQHRKDGHSGASQSSGMPDDFLSRSDSLSLERSTRVQSMAVQAHVLPADTDSAISSRRHEKHSINTISSSTAVVDVVSSNTIVVPRTGFDDGNTSRSSLDADVLRKDRRVRTEGMSSCARIRSSGAGAGVRTGGERLLRKRGNPSRPDVAGSIRSGSLVSSTRPVGSAREMVSGSGREAHNGSGQRRELLGSTTPQTSTRKDPIDRNGLTSTNRITSNNASGPKEGSRKKVGRDMAARNRQYSNTLALASSTSVRPVARSSLHNKVSEKRGCQNTQVCDTTCVRMPAVDAKCMETSPSVVATSEKEEFSRLLKAKINDHGLSDRVESSDALSGKLTASVLQELISALTNDTNTLASQNNNYSDSSAPLHNDGTVYNSNDQSPDFQKCYQGDQEVDSSATCTNNEPNQPSPTSVLESCFSNDTSSLGSPVEKIEGKEFFVSIENKMEDLFNLESDMVDLAMSVDTKTGAEEMFHGSGKMSCVQNFAAHDFNFLEARLHSIGEAISNAELLLGSSLLCSTTSSLSLHTFIIEMMQTVADVFGGSERFGLTEENKYQRTNFLFDCIVESLNSKFCNFGKCGYKAWLRLPLTLSKDLLKREISEEINSWRNTRETARNQVAEKELDQVTARWDTCQVEAFDISIAIENDILEALVYEFAFDQW